MASSLKRSWRLQDFVAHSSNVNCVALGHKSGRVLVTGGDDKKVNLWAVGKLNCIMSLSGHTTPVECVQFGYTEEFLCAGSQSGALKIWDLEAAKIVRTLTGHKGSIRCIDFHPYGDFLTSGSMDTAIKLWDIRRKGCIFTYPGHRMAVNSVKFSPDGQWVASGGEEGLVKLWDLRIGRLLKEFSEHSGAITTVKFHPNEFLLASGSADRTVKFWDLENFQLVSSSEKDVGTIRCITFSPDGECLFSGSQELLKVHGWEPARTFDTLPMSWGKVQDVACAHKQLIGVSHHITNVALHVVDLSKVHPFGGSAIPSPFSTGQSIRKSFSRDKPFNVAKATLDVKTIEEADRSGTDPEDEPQSFSTDIPNVGDYQAIFQPNRKLNRTPPPEPFPAPPEDDPSLPQIVQATSSLERAGPPSLSSSGGSAESASVPAVSRVEEPPLPQVSASSPRLRPTAVRRLSSCQEGSPAFPEVDFSVKLNNIRHCPSEPSLNRPNSTYSRTQSLSRNNLSSLTNSAQTAVVPPSSTVGRAEGSSQHSRSSGNPAPVASSTSPTERERRTTTSPPQQRLPPPVDIRVPAIRQEMSSLPPNPDEEEPNFVPMFSERPIGIDIEDFLPKSYSRSFQYQQSFPDMSEAEVLSSVMRGHENMMTVLRDRQKNHQHIFSIWQNKDMKVAVDFALALGDLSIIADLLGILNIRPTIWNLDMCGALLPSIADLLQSKYEMYLTTAVDALRLILRNFAPVIKSNMRAPIQTVGVDISREERYHKCAKCHDQLLLIRSQLLKRQTMQGKLGAAFRELSALMQNLD